MGQDMKRLLPINDETLSLQGPSAFYLNDNIMDGMGQLVMHASDSSYASPLAMSLALRQFHSGETITLDIDANSTYTFVPFNLHANHWTMFVISHKKRRIYFYDPLSADVPTDPEVVQAALVLKQVLKSSTQKIYRAFVADNVPLQQDLINCGVYIIMLMVSLALRHSFCTRADNANLHRLYIAHWIMRGSIRFNKISLEDARIETVLDEQEEDLFGDREVAQIQSIPRAKPVATSV